MGGIGSLPSSIHLASLATFQAHQHPGLDLDLGKSSLCLSTKPSTLAEMGATAVAVLEASENRNTRLGRTKNQPLETCEEMEKV